MASKDYLAKCSILRGEQGPQAGTRGNAGLAIPGPLCRNILAATLESNLDSHFQLEL